MHIFRNSDKNMISSYSSSDRYTIHLPSQYYDRSYYHNVMKGDDNWDMIWELFYDKYTAL